MKQRMMLLLVLGATFMALPSRAQTSIVQNGSFEQGFTGWGYTYNFGIAAGFPDAADGRNWAEVYGTIFQNLPTTPGQQYDLRFALAGNFNISSPAVTDVLWGSANIGSVSWNPAGHNINNMGWVWTDFIVTASTSTTLLTFENPYVGDGSGRIDRIDAVSVVAVPEPSSLLLLGLGVIALFGLAIIRNRSASSTNRSR